MARCALHARPQVFLYSCRRSSWHTVPPENNPVPPRRDHAVVALGSYVYIIGGQGQGHGHGAGPGDAQDGGEATRDPALPSRQPPMEAPAASAPSLPMAPEHDKTHAGSEELTGSGAGAGRRNGLLPRAGGSGALGSQLLDDVWCLDLENSTVARVLPEVVEEERQQQEDGNRAEAVAVVTTVGPGGLDAGKDLGRAGAAGEGVVELVVKQEAKAAEEVEMEEAAASLAAMAAMRGMEAATAAGVVPPAEGKGAEGGKEAEAAAAAVSTSPKAAVSHSCAGGEPTDGSVPAAAHGDGGAGGAVAGRGAAGPCARCGHSATVVGDSVLLFGGVDEAGR